MNKETLSKLREAEKAASKAPWNVGHIDEHLDRGEIENSDGIIVASDCRRNDEPFLCLARNHMAELLDEIDLLKAKVMASERVITGLCDTGIMRAMANNAFESYLREEIARIKESK